MDTDPYTIHVRNLLGKRPARRIVGYSQTAIDALLFFFLLLILCSIGMGLALAFLKLSGWIHVPTEMKAIYQSVRDKLHEAGWG